MSAILVSLPGNERLADALAAHMNAEIAHVVFHHFPDGETYVRYQSKIDDKTVWLICTLDRPDPKFVPLMIAAETAKDLNADRVGLIAPYLAYMRQDARFRPGEAVSSEYFARVLSCVVDALVTVDPHLHRRTSLNDIYRVPTSVVHAAPTVAAWIRREVSKPLLIGPDAESEQWVGEVARHAGAPHIVLKKIRHGDREVDVSVPEVERWSNHTPVLVDDIVSTAHTMIETVGHLLQAGMRAPICVAVHAIFAEEAHSELKNAGASRVVSCNTIEHVSNALDISNALAEAALTLPWAGVRCCPRWEERKEGSS